MNEELSIMGIIQTLLKKWYVLIIVAVIGGMVSYTYTDMFVAPRYSAGTTIYVNAGNTRPEEVSASNITASQQLVNTYAEILKGRNFLTKISKELRKSGFNYNADQIRGMLSMGAVNETEVLSVRVTGTDKEGVYAVAMKLVDYSTDELKNVVGAGSATILEDPVKPVHPVSPNVKKNTMMGVLIGLAIAAAFVVMLDLLDTRIRGGEEFENNYDEPLLGQIPTLEEVQTQESRGR